jgi:uncharacterized protein (TIGR03435 family)
MIRRAIAILVCAAALRAQTFEVASVRVRKSDDKSFYAIAGRFGPKLTVQNLSMMLLLQRAFDVRRYQVAGPAWLEQVKLDIKAKMPVSALREEVPAALQSLLKERFNLGFHRENRTLPYYVLSGGKSGSKLKPAANPRIPVSGTWKMRGTYVAKNDSMAHFCEELSRHIGFAVVNATELNGGFDFVLDFTPNDFHFSDPAGMPSLFNAVQNQLGLKLESKKGPVEMLVIDRLDRAPTRN